MRRDTGPPGRWKSSSTRVRAAATTCWRRYLEQNQFEDGWLGSAELSKFFDVFTDRMRGILKDAGIKTVR